MMPNLTLEFVPFKGNENLLGKIIPVTKNKIPSRISIPAIIIPPVFKLKPKHELTNIFLNNYQDSLIFHEQKKTKKLR